MLVLEPVLAHELVLVGSQVLEPLLAEMLVVGGLHSDQAVKPLCNLYGQLDAACAEKIPTVIFVNLVVVLQTASARKARLHICY